MQRIAIIAAALSLAACAKSPDAIGPAYMSDIPYRGYTCPQLNEEYSRLEGALRLVSAHQQDVRDTDAVAMIVLGTPVSHMAGTNAQHEIARLKGGIDAVARAAIRTNCRRADA